MPGPALRHIIGQPKGWVEDKGLTVRWVRREENLAGVHNESL